MDGRAALAAVEGGRQALGDAATPLWFRSGAALKFHARHDGHRAEPRPHGTTLRGLIDATGDERFAYDTYRRFIMMFSTSCGTGAAEVRALQRGQAGGRLAEDSQLPAAALRDVVARFKRWCRGDGRRLPR
jgi:pyruvate,orthophosphate dikinase